MTDAPEVIPPARGQRRGGHRPRWLLIAIVVGTFCSALLLHGLVRSEIGVDATGAAKDGNDDQVPPAVSEGGPIIDLTQGRVQSYALPPKTVALTFDDGPDPQWTPEILAVLTKYHVPATFFVVGSRAALDPDLLRQIRASGSEIGIHTFTHPDLSQVSPSRVDRELTETQYTLAGATGELSYLLRPPYSSEASALDNKSFGVINRLGPQGYVTALTDVDPNDWQQPGVDAIVRDVVPADGHGGVVLLHDAGGDRSQTVEALDEVIPQMQSDGYTFVTVSASAGLPPANFPAGPTELTLGRIVLAAVAVAVVVVDALEWSLLVVGGLMILRLLVMVVVAMLHHRRRATDRTDRPAFREPVSVVVPAHNEKECIASTVRSLVASAHPVEVIVVDDGSTDGTADIVESLGLSGVRVVRQPNGGKPAALNTGIAAASHDIVVMMDGDTIFEPTTVGNLVQPFREPGVGAVAGNARVADRNSLIARWQHIEYVIGFNIDRRGQDYWRAITTIPGAIGAFRTAALRDAGGVSADTLAEDTDLTIAIGRAGWRVVYEPTALAWTEAPATFGQLWRQRYRWSYGIMQSLWKHRHAVVERGHSGHLGRVGLLLTALFQIILPLLAPMVDIYLIYGLVFLEPVTTAVIWGSVMALQLTVGVIAFRLEGEPLRGLLLLPLQQIVYRQLMYAVLIQSSASALAGARLGWQKVPRVGEFTAAPQDHGAQPVPVSLFEPASAMTSSPLHPPVLSVSPNPPTTEPEWLGLPTALALAAPIAATRLHICRGGPDEGAAPSGAVGLDAGRPAAFDPCEVPVGDRSGPDGDEQPDDAEPDVVEVDVVEVEPGDSVGDGVGEPDVVIQDGDQLDRADDEGDRDQESGDDDVVVDLADQVGERPVVSEVHEATVEGVEQGHTGEQQPQDQDRVPGQAGSGAAAAGEHEQSDFGGGVEAEPECDSEGNLRPGPRIARLSRSRNRLKNRRLLR